MLHHCLYLKLSERGDWNISWDASNRRNLVQTQRKTGTATAAMSLPGHPAGMGGLAVARPAQQWPGHADQAVRQAYAQRALSSRGMSGRAGKPKTLQNLRRTMSGGSGSSLVAFMHSISNSCKPQTTGAGRDEPIGLQKGTSRCPSAAANYCHLPIAG